MTDTFTRANTPIDGTCYICTLPQSQCICIRSGREYVHECLFGDIANTSETPSEWREFWSEQVARLIAVAIVGALLFLAYSLWTTNWHW